MNYLKHYCNLIRKAENRVPPEGYTEKHHTFPVSIFGKNKRIVVLTAREHYIAHALLEKICIKRYGLEHYRTYKMTNAHIMIKSNGYYNSYLYEGARVRKSENMKGNLHRLGVNHNEKTKEKIGKSNFGKRRTKEQRIALSQSCKGRKHTQETKEKIGKSNKGKKRPPLTPEHIEKLRQANIGRTPSEETIEKIRKSNIGQKRSEECIKKMKENRPDFSGSKNPNSKTWEVVLNTGEVLIIKCLSDWAKSNGCNVFRLYDIASKKQKTHKNVVSVRLLKNQ
jgi:hypothetical protein